MKTQIETLLKLSVEERLKRIETHINNLNVAVGIGSLGTAGTGIGSNRGVFAR